MQLENVKLSADGESVVILDQTLLPNEEKYITLTTPEQCWEAIHSLRVRGAPAIGIFAGYAIYVLARQYAELDGDSFREKFRDRCIRLPMISDARSLNLANSVAILTYEALRQQGFPELSGVGSMAEH